MLDYSEPWEAGVAHGKISQGAIKLLLAGLMVVLLIVVQVLVYAACLYFGYDELFYTEMAGAIALVGAMVVLGAGSWLRLSGKATGFSMRFCWWISTISLLVLLLESIGLAVEGPTEGWPLHVCELMLLCLFIGLFEELLFRGLMLNGLLAVLGRWRWGVVFSVLFSSLCFGLMHVDFTLDYSDSLLLAQAVLKVVQTGLLGVLLAVVALRTRNLIGVSLVHGLSDFLLMFVSIGLQGGTVETTYVAQGDEGLSTIVVYAVIIALYLPSAIKGLRLLHAKMPGPDTGAFMEGYALVAALPSDGAVPRIMLDDGPPRPDGL